MRYIYIYSLCPICSGGIGHASNNLIFDRTVFALLDNMNEVL